MKINNKLTRRDFLYLTANLSLSAFAISYLFLDADIAEAKNIKVIGSKSLVYATGGTDSELTISAINKIGGIKLQHLLEML